MKILLSGGGTLGPVTPLLAIASAYKKHYPETEFIWIGTNTGPERELVEKAGIKFVTISAGKLRRYFSVWNLVDMFKLKLAFWQAWFIIRKVKPNLIISAGGFVSVPVHWAGWFWGVPSWVHQQDVVPGLANRLVTPIAKKITTALADSVQYFPKHKTEWIGNPVRDMMVPDKLASRAKFGIPAAAPVVFAMGGGTGSMRVNNLVVESLSHWPKDWHVLHLVGRDRSAQIPAEAAKIFPNYHVYVFFTDEMKDAYAAADVVVARAGFASITELAALSKAAVLVPMADTHQEDNAKYFGEKNAAIVYNERAGDGLALAKEVQSLMDNSVQRELLGKKLHQVLPPAGEGRLVEIVKSL
ncbi:MAG: glycosyltransferase [bacterium]|nr:glycosyltransferase [bacterium]